MKNRFLSLALAFSLAIPGSAIAADDIMAQPWQYNFQPAATPVMHKLTDLNHSLTILAVVISVFVMLLMGYICLRFNSKRNPVASKNSHNTVIEIIWTVVPVFILAAVFIPSYRIHFDCVHNIGCSDDGVPANPDLTLKVIGYQWYWNYEYPDHGIKFDSYMKKTEDLQPGEPRLLTVDNPIVVPVNANVRVLVTGGDVIHSFAMPAFGMKQDGVPGRLNETWFRADKEGTYHGQCSELCGRLHGFMPITIKVVSPEEFAAWIVTAKEKFASDGSAHVAALK